MTGLSALLAKAQAEMKNAALNKTNPHFKSKYADLGSIRDAVVPPLAKHGLSVTQTTDFNGESFILRTTLRGPNGECIESTYPLPVAKPQEMGSAITYARRYTLAALVGIAAEEDDDGNAAQSAPPPEKQAKQSKVETFKADLEKELAAAPTDADVTEVTMRHEKALDWLEKNKPEEFNAVCDMIAERRAELSTLNAA